jgi:hypothetical protein
VASVRGFGRINPRVSEPMEEKPKRRWRTFSIRTLLLLMIPIGCWLGWNLHQVRERQKLLKAWETHLDYFGYFGWIDTDLVVGPPHWDSGKLPFCWELLGAKPVEILTLPAHQFSDSEADRIRRLFPETKVTFY